jgi:hypothetical protein
LIAPKKVYGKRNQQSTIPAFAILPLISKVNNDNLASRDNAA